MNNLLKFIFPAAVACLLFAACSEEEVDVFAKGYDGVYFKTNSSGTLDTTVNFANHLLDKTAYVAIPIDVSIVGYVKGTGIRKAVVKSRPLDGYPEAKVEVDEIIFEDGEYQKQLNVKVYQPDTIDKVYAVCLYIDSNDSESQLGAGINGKAEYTVYVSESYTRPSNWNSTFALYLGAWSVEKHKFMVYVLQNDQYTQTINWGDYNSYNMLAVDSIRKYNQQHPDASLSFGIPFVEYCTYNDAPYYWGSLQEKYFGTYTSQHFIAITKALNVTTQNEANVIGTNDESILAAGNRNAVRGMMQQYNEYYNWYYLSATDYEDYINVPILPDADYDVVAPKMWTESPTADVVKQYYGDYSPEKYKFILKILSSSLGNEFTLARLFPFDLFYDFEGQLKMSWNTKFNGESLMKQYHDIVKAAYDNETGLTFEIP